MVIGVSERTGVAFLLNALTFAAIIVALLLMDPTSFHPRELTRPRAQVIEGLRSSMMRSDLRTPLIATFVLSMLAQNFRLTLPLMASQVFAAGSPATGCRCRRSGSARWSARSVRISPVPHRGSPGWRRRCSVPCF